MGKFIDLSNRKFGRLTVIEKSKTYRQPNGKTVIYWRCKCNCNNETNIEVRSDLLRDNKIQSCGCLHKEIVKNKMKNNTHNKKYNTYDLSGEYGVGYTTKGEKFYFDLEDYDKIKDYCWHFDCSGYVVSNIKRKTIYFHRLLFNKLSNFTILQIDHIKKQNKYDNRKCNLRICTPSKNSMNRGLRIDNTTGVTGVYWYKPRNEWVAKISVNGKNIHLGYFKNFKDAVKVRKEAEEKYFGEYSYDNSQKLEINKNGGIG